MRKTHRMIYRRIKPCSNNCHAIMTKAGTCLISGLYKTMLRSLSWDEDKSRRMFLITVILNHAQTIVMRWRQQPPNDSLYGHLKRCSGHCQSITTTAVACLKSGLYKTMLRPLAWGEDDSRPIFLYTVIWNHSQTSHCMFLYTAIYNHTSAIVMRWWYQPVHVSLYGRINHARTIAFRLRQQPAHVRYLGYIKPYSDHCHEMRTTAAACFFIQPYKTMSKQLPSYDDKSQHMFDIRVI